jgi:hypothetical protein
VHGPAEQQRLQHVPLELHDRDHDAQRDEGLDGPDGHQSHQDRHRAGEERADDRDEGAEEHQRGQRDDQRYLEDRQADADADRVDECHGHGGADVGDQGAPRPAGRLVEVGPRVAGEQSDHPQPDGPAVLQEEEQREQRQDDPGEHLPDRGGGGDGPGGELVLAADQEVLRLGDRVLELAPGDGEGADDEPLHLVEALADLAGQIGEAVDEALYDERDDPGDDGEADEQHRERGQRPVPAAPHQGRGAGLQQRGQQQRDDDRDDHHPDVHGGVEEHVGAGDHGDQPPGPGGRDPQGGGDVLLRRPPRVLPQPPATLARPQRAPTLWRSAGTARPERAVQIGGAGLGAAEGRPGRPLRLLVDGTLVDGVLVDGVLVRVVVPIGGSRRDVLVGVPGVRVVLTGGADAFAGPCGEIARASEHSAPPVGPLGAVHDHVSAAGGCPRGATS